VSVSYLIMVAQRWRWISAFQRPLLPRLLLPRHARSATWARQLTSVPGRSSRQLEGHLPHRYKDKAYRAPLCCRVGFFMILVQRREEHTTRAAHTGVILRKTTQGTHTQPLKEINAHHRRWVTTSMHHLYTTPNSIVQKYKIPLQKPRMALDQSSLVAQCWHSVQSWHVI
jgi:hypothetical protein